MNIRNNTPPALLLGGNHIALTAARSLGSRGIRVYLLDERGSYARRSRFCSWIDTGKPGYGPSDWVGWLTDKGKKFLPGAVILPCDDNGVETVARNRSVLERDFRVIEANDDVSLQVLNKEATHGLATRIGMNTPRIEHITSREDLARVSSLLRFPCALKPTQSFKSHVHLPFLKLVRVESGEEMIRAYDLFTAHGLGVIATEMIPQTIAGYNSYTTYIDRNGEPLFNFTKRKLRQYPALYGLGTYHVSDWSEDVATEGRKFLKGAGLRGVGNVEFMRDPRDGQLKFIECNARFMATIQNMVDSGINLPLIAYHQTLGAGPPVLNGYRKGVHLIRVLADIQSFRDMRRHGTMTFGQWVRSLLHPQKFLYFRWNDPLPVFTRVIPFLRHQFGKVTGRAGKISPQQARGNP